MIFERPKSRITTWRPTFPRALDPRLSILFIVDDGLGTRIVAEALTRPGPEARRILLAIIPRL